MAMLYRHRLEFAVGHGVAVAADVVPDDPERAARVYTVVAPVHEVARVDSAGPSDSTELDGLALDMKLLAEAEPRRLPAMLAPLPEAYRAWIARQEARVEAGDDGLGQHQEAAETALARCDEVCGRIQEGIRTISDSRGAAAAFQFANRAM